ncbi:serine acetyltransferase [Arenibacter sp. TNZ]|jgi:serine O-acetyltransferase|uniref:serine O-acetyltransferase n=1 Tax=Arenibacter TaxID=178469 RepID=UPI000CD497E3|nr:MULTISPECIES: serine acetyltransferase [Arenibacter]MCM4174104.1 serine acetyltransferase [Arenibacter sp. TNZ]
MNNTIKADLYRYGGETSILKGLRIEGFRYMYCFRNASKHKKYSPFGLFYRFLLRRLKYKYGFQIPLNTQIGEGFYIGHYGTIVINVNAKIGRYCNITHNTTIGMANRGKLKGFPTIGDYVWIGTGSVIVGNINIGNNVLIAPNSFVNMDIPDQSLVIGNPAKIISKDNPTGGYINNILSMEQFSKI